nr:tRNA (adenosine(37)-N6)-dimethylallyltransferase MiaA [Aureimonas altamirensis]
MAGLDRLNAILIAGPTASGKSKLAVDLARSHGGVVVNADSMQIYDGLRILTARPTESDMGGIPHRLYGYADPSAPYSTGMWLTEVERVLQEIRAAGAVPVFVGGTGLYFRALTQGLDDMPAIAPELRAALRARHAEEGPGRMHEALGALDPQAAARLRPTDSQRILRALELVMTTGRPLATLQEGKGRPLLADAGLRRIVLAPDRAVLRDRIARRFEAMMAEGAREEALRFARRPGALDHSAGQAIGLAELLAAERGDMAPHAAVERAVVRTRQYAKRQETWFRNQFGPDWERLKS